MFEYLEPGIGRNCLRRIKKYGLGGRGVSLGAGFQVWKCSAFLMCSLLSVCGRVCELSAAAPMPCVLPDAMFPAMMVLDSLTGSPRWSIPLISYLGYGVYPRGRKVARTVRHYQFQSPFSLGGCISYHHTFAQLQNTRSYLFIFFLLRILEAKSKNFKAVLLPKVLWSLPLFLPSWWLPASLVLQWCQFCLHKACSLWVSSKSLCLFD